jgi:hypothetical protein
MSHAATRHPQRKISIEREERPTNSGPLCSSAPASERLRLVRRGSPGLKRATIGDRGRPLLTLSALEELGSFQARLGELVLALELLES